MPTSLGAFAVGEAIAVSSASVRRRWFGWLRKATEEITLTRGDIALLEAVLTEIHGKPVGTVASWDNSKTGNSGAVRLLERMTYNDQDCEALQYDLQNGNCHERHVVTSCLQPDEAWKVVWRETSINSNSDGRFTKSE